MRRSCRWVPPPDPGGPFAWPKKPGTTSRTCRISRVTGQGARGSATTWRLPAHRADREIGAQAQRRRRGQPCGGRLGLRPERLSGRADRHGPGTGPSCGRRHPWCDPAPCGDDGVEGHRRDHQGRRGAYLFTAAPELIEKLQGKVGDIAHPTPAHQGSLRSRYRSCGTEPSPGRAGLGWQTNAIEKASFLSQAILWRRRSSIE